LSQRLFKSLWCRQSFCPIFILLYIC